MLSVRLWDAYCFLWIIWANKQGNRETSNEFLSTEPSSSLQQLSLFPSETSSFAWVQEQKSDRQTTWFHSFRLFLATYIVPWFYYRETTRSEVLLSLQSPRQFLCKLPAMLLATGHFYLRVGNTAACNMNLTFLLFRDMAQESWLCQRKALSRKRFPSIPLSPALAGAGAGFWGWRPG